MNRTNICKNIVQSIKDYITDQVKLEPHRVEKHFVRRRKLSLLQVIIYLFFSSKASMFQNLSQIREELGTLSFPDVSKQALSKARQFINPSLFKELYYLSVDLFYSQIPSRKREFDSWISEKSTCRSHKTCFFCVKFLVFIYCILLQCVVKYNKGGILHASYYIEI